MARFSYIQNTSGANIGCWDNVTGAPCPMSLCDQQYGNNSRRPRGNRFGSRRLTNSFRETKNHDCGCGCDGDCNEQPVALSTALVHRRGRVNLTKSNRLVQFPMSNLNTGLMKFGQTRAQRSSSNRFGY